jgi:aspartate/methionine/tyrosine aminotransferase
MSAMKVQTGCRIDDIKSKITQMKAIVVINPNNPTGALYPVEVCNKS